MTFDFSRFNNDDEQEMVEFLTREQFEMVAETEESVMAEITMQEIPTAKTNRVGVRKLSREEVLASFNFA